MSRRPTLLRTAPVARSSRGAWNRIRLPVSGLGEATILFVSLHDERGEALNGEVLTPLTLLGAAIIVGSGLFIFWREQAVARRATA